MRELGIYAVDPGTTTGVARGIFPFSDSVWDGIALGRWESWDVEGTPGAQAWEIMGEFLDWQRSISPTKVALVFEDFVMALATGPGSTRRLLDPVRVTSACDALCWTRQGLRWAFPELQPPSDKGSYTNARLRAHGLWVRGSSEHRRDAIRHMVKRYSRYVRENTPKVQLAA
jgi:hypothetical protein